MKTILKPLLIALPFLLASCTSTKTIQKYFDSNSHSMAYLMESPVADSKLDVALTIDSVKMALDVMPKKSLVEKKSGYFIPLVFVYTWKSEHKCTQGESLMSENITDFFRQAVADQVERAGKFSIDTLNRSDYHLSFSIDEIGATGPYISNGFAYFVLYVYGYSVSEVAGPAMASLKVSYVLKKADQVVMQNTLSAQRATDPISQHSSNTKQLIRDYGISMVEATSFNFRDIVGQVVSEINAYFSGIPETNLNLTAETKN
ncbi:MAG: hypothetical protein QM786_18600 [Breznakibacter sp.]